MSRNGSNLKKRVSEASDIAFPLNVAGMYTHLAITGVRIFPFN